MIDAEIDIVTKDGSMNTFISHPEEGGPLPNHPFPDGCTRVPRRTS